MSPAEFERVAALEDAEVGIDTSKMRFYRGYNFPTPDVRAIRERLGISQSEFSRRFKLSERTLQQWEQGRTTPDQPARVLLNVISVAPEVVERIMATEEKRLRGEPLSAKRPRSKKIARSA
jgi:putative transcriptional regulator